MPPDDADRTRWVWLDNPPTGAVNYYVDFRRQFDAARSAGRWTLRVSVNSQFAAWLNGSYVGNGQYTDYPDERTFSSIDLSSHVRPGGNVLAIQVYYGGVDHSSYIPGEAGLWYELEADGVVVVRSDTATRCRLSGAYTSELTTRITPQRGFTFHHRAEAGPAWQDEGYTCGPAWSPTVVTACRQTPSPRPVRMLDTSECVPGAVVAQGVLRRGGGSNLSELMQHDYLSARRPWELFDDMGPTSEPVQGGVTLTPDHLEGADGYYLVYDLGKQVCGYLRLQMSGAGRCVLDVAVGEHLDDLRVRANVGGRGFASRYVTRQGGQDFTHWHDRYAGRYIQVHVTEIGGRLRLERVGLVAADYPVEETGRFHAPDGLTNLLWQTCSRTLRLCMHEHYEDSPWREQALYANDMRNQMLSGFYLFKGYDFARASMELLRRSAGHDGYLRLCAPMRSAFTIPGFTMTWLLALRDYYLYSGDHGYARLVLPEVRRMLGCYESRLVHGLLPCPGGEAYWHFYDWAPGLDGTDPEGRNGLFRVDGVRFDAPLNALWLLAVRAVAEIAEHLGEHEYAASCRSMADTAALPMHELFFDSVPGCYRTYAGHDAAPHFAELTQALMVLAGVGDDVVRHDLRRRLAACDDRLVPTTLSQSLYKYEAVLQEGQFGPAVWSAVMDRWSPMLLKGATSFWETERGGWDFHHAGSLCHGWSAIPAYLFGAYGLGIRPAGPGFQQVRLNPVFGLNILSGVVPTPLGELTLELRREDGKYTAAISCPRGVDIHVDPKKITHIGHSAGSRP